MPSLLKPPSNSLTESEPLSSSSNASKTERSDVPFCSVLRSNARSFSRTRSGESPFLMISLLFFARWLLMKLRNSRASMPPESSASRLRTNALACFLSKESNTSPRPRKPRYNSSPVTRPSPFLSSRAINPSTSPPWSSKLISKSPKWSASSLSTSWGPSRASRASLTNFRNSTRSKSPELSLSRALTTRRASSSEKCAKVLPSDFKPLRSCRASTAPLRSVSSFLKATARSAPSSSNANSKSAKARSAGSRSAGCAMIVNGGVGGEADGSPRSWAISSGLPTPPLFAKAVTTPTDGLPPNLSRTNRRCSEDVPVAPITFIASDRQASSTLDPRFSSASWKDDLPLLAQAALSEASTALSASPTFPLLPNCRVNSSKLI
mmetsp:Transcript_8991/g.26119  ORF Transcript_8991/g.26119 Transcript_8991/m.26119 type:complete len:379 (+) Transcript_8991:3537-4673(+)